MLKAESNFSLSSIFWTKQAYRSVAAEFHPFHKHDLNALLHVATTGLGVWGAIQMAVSFDFVVAVYIYTGIITLTTPLLPAVFHFLFVYACLLVPIETLPLDWSPLSLSLLAIAAGFGLQDLAH